MNHLEFINKKIDKKLGNDKSPSYCNIVDDSDMWIIAGVANILNVYKKEEGLVPITPEEYRKLLSYVKISIGYWKVDSAIRNLEILKVPLLPVLYLMRVCGINMLTLRMQDTMDKTIRIFLQLQNIRVMASVGILSHARRFVHVFDALLKSKDILGLDFPTKELMSKMANQLVYGTFNRDFKKPLFTNFMDGTNGWFRIGYSGREGFGYGPSDLSIAVLEGGYGFWSRYNPDIQDVFVALMNMMKSNDPEIKKHVVEHYETNNWNHYKRTHDYDFKKSEDPNTQSVLIQLLPSLCFMNKV